MKKFVFLIIALVIAELTSTVASSEIKVVDGDSLELKGRRIRLIGIDAPEYTQNCHAHDGTLYPCGIHAKDFLEQLIDEGKRNNQKLKCVAQDIDRYKRDLSVCYLGDVNLNYQMVKSGWATAYRYDLFQKAEKRAKKRQIGIWQGKFMRPEIYRALKREKEKQKNIVN